MGKKKAALRPLLTWPMAKEVISNDYFFFFATFFVAFFFATFFVAFFFAAMECLLVIELLY
ncbi:MAG: hypothetical protein AABY86_15455 [Bdellovibrionota bacterium]